MKATLVLSDGEMLHGRALGASGITVGETVFNTGMTGYQEILTDPSYAGQLVTLTYPLIGNYGINDDDSESARIQAAGLIVREACEVPSNWRCTMTLDAYMREKGLIGIQGIDTRELTKRIRGDGVRMGAITTGDPDEALAILRETPGYGETDFVGKVSTRVPYAWGHSGRESLDRWNEPGRYKHKLVVLDCGLKYNILRRFAALGVRSLVLPATTTADEILEWQPDGVLLSPGPGDPALLGSIVGAVRGILGKLPVFGICLGNQILCHAVGGRTYKMPFGHRGSNHPVKDLLDGTVTITSQNHGYAIDPDSLAGTGAEITQINLNDDTVEGIRIPELRAQSIQYHPEAAPGPWDSRKYFAQFLQEIENAPAR